MSNYIYRPPPPPPPPSSNSGNSGNRGGYNTNSQRGTGGNCGGRGGGARNGDFNRGGGNNAGGAGQWGGPNHQQYQQFTQRRQPHPLPQFPPTAHYNTAFVAQQQNQQYHGNQQYQQYPLYQQQPQPQPYSNPYFNNNPTYTNPQYQQTPPPPPPQQQLQNPYLSYSQEHYQSQLPQPVLPKPPQQQQQHSPLPTAGWPAHSSYGHFGPPSQAPPRKQQKRERDDKPDMDEATWLSLNGGKLIGTNIAPPETPEEIEAWIAQRKSRFPTAKKIKENMVKKQEVAAKAEEEARRVAAQQEKERGSKAYAAGCKRKRAAADTGEGDGASLLVGSDIDNDYDTNASNSDDDDDDDAPPEVTSSKLKPTVPEATIKKLEGQGSKKSTARCRDFLRGKCAKGDRCRFRHKRKEQVKKSTKTEEKKTLYQRLVEHDREKENTLMLQVIQYLIDKGRLLEETPLQQGAGDCN